MNIILRNKDHHKLLEGTSTVYVRTYRVMPWCQKNSVCIYGPYMYISTPIYLLNICMIQKNTLNIAVCTKKRHETIFASKIFSSWRRHGKKRCLRRIAGQLLVTRRCIANFRPKIQVEEVAHFLFRHTKRWENMKTCETNSPVELRVF